jgi:nanoRNase/pAp phosphatase (c-di-AMP/oligoRNAs hydrolase)
MSEVAKLRQRLKNVKRGTVEYRMTVAEATALLAEIEKIETPVIQTIHKEEPRVQEKIMPRIMDGGTF